ncbi:S-layer homology domain-containing protein [uncultured Pseudoflavonifractor sp.]|uniref:S-layer homology domain-containing protein n=1 Tax=uncultured Pseudoflavonifractor sp. TaxID=1221379 RepID=UPI0025E85F0E|nr:S-layer homology domain-containing protein [uncultured Pseudoflavonifractor sp.]
MKKALSLMLVLTLLLSVSLPALAADSSPSVTVQTVAWPVVKGSESAPANTATYYHYIPDGFKFRGNSTPVIFVLGDKAWTQDTANEALTRGGFDQMAADENGHIVFVSPSNGKNWTADDYALMQTLATNITDDYTYELEQQGTYDTGIGEDGRLFAGRFRLYTFAEGSAQAFVKEYLDTPDATYWVAQWDNLVDGFGAGFHYADEFSRDDNLNAWASLRRTNRLSMMDGVSYVGEYSVYSDYGIEERVTRFTASSGVSFEYCIYLPDSIDLTAASGKYPLVFVFHGANQHPDGYIHLMDWPVVGDQYGFFTVAVNGNQTNADLLELLDQLIETYPIDASRVYSTGYSMGGMKTISLGFEHTERFAAIAPTEAIPNMGRESFSYDVPAQEIPTFWIGGEGEFHIIFPKDTPYAVDFISLLAETNGFTYSGIYDESLEYYFGTTFDRTYTYNRAPAYHGDAGIWSIHEMLDRDGVPSTLLSSISKLGHSAYLPSAERIWKFFTQFSRAEDGTSVYHPTPWTDVAAGSWYEDAAAHAYANGLMTASNGGFDPAGSFTGDMLANALYALAGTPAAESATSWASSNALPTGSVALTRGQIAQALYDFMALMDGNRTVSADLSSFSDGAGAPAALQWAVGAGIINGRSDGTLAVNETASRSEAAVMLQRLALFLAQ